MVFGIPDMNYNEVQVGDLIHHVNEEIPWKDFLFLVLEVRPEIPNYSIYHGLSFMCLILEDHSKFAYQPMIQADDFLLACRLIARAQSDSSSPV
jgi:hypothetical protein